MSITEKRTCPKCGAEMPQNALEGQCPRCMARVVFGQESDKEESHGEEAERKMTIRVEPPPSADAEGLADLSGRRIGRYKLLEQIGEGGFGEVYMAEQIEPVQRKVAFKIIKAGMDSRQIIARFEAERQALALMDHPNIAKVLDAGTTETGRPYFVMELVRGISITSYCDQKRLSTTDRLELFIEVCHAVQHAHQKGIIHRDIKPSNVLVTLHDGEPVPKVIDFGIAKALGQKLTDKTIFTGFAQLIGTPAYMSPEQAELSGLDMDTRSDIYSLGVLLYELLTGVTPFDKETMAKAALDEIRRMIRETDPPRPSTRVETLGAKATEIAKDRHTEPEVLRKQVRGDLDWIVMKCLEKDRTRRYETANGLVMDIQRHLSSEPVVARPPSNVYRLQKLVRRNKLVFAAGLVVFFVVVLGLIGTSWQALRATRAQRQADRHRERADRNADSERTQREKAQQARLKAETEAALSAQVAQFMKDMLKGVEPGVARGRDTKLLHEILDQTAGRFNDLKGQPAVEADLRVTLGQVYRQLGDLSNAEAMCREAVRLCKTAPDDPHSNLGDALDGLGLVLRSEGKIDEAIPVLRDSIATRRNALGNDHPDVAASLQHLGVVLRTKSDATEAEAVTREALRIYRQQPDGHKSDLATCLALLGTVLRAQHKLSEAEAAYRESLDLGGGATADDDAYVTANLSLTLLAQGELAAAEDMARGAVAMQRKLGDSHPGLGKSLKSLGRVLAGRGKLAEAESALNESLAILRATLGEDNFETSKGVGELGKVLVAQGKQAEAVLVYRPHAERGHLAAANELAWLLATSNDPKVRDGRSAIAYAEQAVAVTDWKNSSYLDTLAAAYAEAGEFKSAVAVQREAISLLKPENGKQDYASRLKLYEDNSPYRDDGPLAELASVRLNEGNFSEAESLARECLILREKQIPDDWRTFNARAMLGGALLGRKKYGEAEPLLLAGYNGMNQLEAKIPALGKPYLKEALQRLVQLYEATGRPEQVAEWKQKLVTYAKLTEQSRPETASLYRQIAREFDESDLGAQVVGAKAASAVAANAPPAASRELLDPTDGQALLQKVGQAVAVRGEVVRFGSSHSRTFHFLNFSEDYTNSLTLAFKIADNRAEFKPELLQQYLNKVVVVQGVVSEHQGRPEILMKSLGQIKLWDDWQTSEGTNQAPK